MQSKIISSEITADGYLEMDGRITKGDKYAKKVGFCYSQSSQPTAYNVTVSGSDDGTIYSDLGINFSLSMKAKIFDSYTGYYFRPFVINVKNETTYGDEVYFANIQKPFSTPPCTLADNAVDPGAGDPAESFTNNQVTANSSNSYVISAGSAHNTFTYTFLERPGTGIYTTASIPSSSVGNQLRVSISAGSVTGYLNNGSQVYVNEVAKNKFEITFCNAPWGNAYHASARMTVAE